MSVSATLPQAFHLPAGSPAAKPFRSPASETVAPGGAVKLTGRLILEEIVNICSSEVAWTLFDDAAVPPAAPKHSGCDPLIPAWQLATCDGEPEQLLNCEMALGQSVANASPLAAMMPAANTSFSCLIMNASQKCNPQLEMLIDHCIPVKRKLDCCNPQPHPNR